MATYNTSVALAGQAFTGVCPPNQVQEVCAVFTITTALAMGDTVNLLKLPAGCTVLDGKLMAMDIDSGTETLDIDIGWAANGTESADTDGFGNLGVWTGDTNNTFDFQNAIFATGPQYFTNETMITLTVNAAAHMGGTGKIWVMVKFAMLG